MQRKFLLSIGVMLLGVIISNAGCSLCTVGPSLGIFSIPVPVSPYFQQAQEDAHWYKERYKDVQILPPLIPGAPSDALDPPSDDQVMVALEKARPVNGGIPFLQGRQRNNVRIKKEKIADYIDEPRMYPLAGMCQLHHTHWKCTVYFTEVTRVGWPVPYTATNEEAEEVVRIDLDHLHMCGNPAGANPTR